MPAVKKIFIVDDDPILAEMLRDYLSRNGNYEITLFKTGEDCLQNLSQKPDLIILDFYLNSIVTHAADGMKILEAIKKHDPHLHVIMLSSQESYGTALKTITKGAEFYVRKGREAFEEISGILKEIGS